MAGAPARAAKKFDTLLDLCVSSLRRGHANLLCIVPILTDDPRRESEMEDCRARAIPRNAKDRVNNFRKLIGAVARGARPAQT